MTKICGVESCLFRNGTMCDRTVQECPRCVTDDTLLGAYVCTGIQEGSACPVGYTLCPQTPLETLDKVYTWTTLNETVPPGAPPAPTPLIRPSVQPVYANNVPLGSASTLTSGSDASGGFPVWVVIALAVAAVAAASIGFVFGCRKRHLDPLTESKNHDTQHERPISAVTPQDAMYHAADHVPDTTYDRGQPTGDNRAHPQLHHTVNPTASYGRYSSDSVDSDVFDGETKRSEDIDVFQTRGGNDSELEFRDSLGVDEFTVRSHMTRASSLSEEDDVDIYSDTAMTTFSDVGPMFSPKSGRTQFGLNFTTFSVDDESTRGGDQHQDADDLELDESLGPDDAPTLPGRVMQPRSVVDDDDVDIYPDTSVTMASEAGRMFSPRTNRTRFDPNSTTFSIDGDTSRGGDHSFYPDTSVTVLPNSRAVAPLKKDIVDVWESHRGSSNDATQDKRHQQLTHWKAKYGENARSIL